MGSVDPPMLEGYQEWVGGGRLLRRGVRSLLGYPRSWETVEVHMEVG